MTRFYDEDDVRVKADRLHAANKYLFAKDKPKTTVRRPPSVAMQDITKVADIVFRAEGRRRTNRMLVTLPKIGGK